MVELRAAEWVDYVPTLKDRIIGKAQDGRWHKNWAERVAKKYEVGPLAERPDSAMFDPMAEVVWTLAMVIAWIVWRTPDDVRENWDAYREKCWEWRWHPRLVSHGGGREWKEIGGWWELKTRDAATLNRLRLSEAVSDCTGKDEVRKLVTVHDAWEELRKRAAAGELTAAAIRNGDGRPVQIPAHEWAYLEQTGDGRLGDELRYDRAMQWQYREVTFQRDEVCGLWPSITVQPNLQKSASAKSVKAAVADLLKTKPNASTRDADKLAMQIHANRASVRAELNAARQKRGNRIMPGRPRKAIL